jgi:hypothetical protein
VLSETTPKNLATFIWQVADLLRAYVEREVSPHVPDAWIISTRYPHKSLQHREMSHGDASLIPLYRNALRDNEKHP